MSRQLVLLRHGRTAWNAEGRIQGHADIELDETGHEQAAGAAPHVASYGPTRLWTSDLARAAQTAAWVAKETGLEPRRGDRFRELGLGERSGLTLADYERDLPEEYAAFRRGDYSQMPGAERISDLAARFEAGLTDVLVDQPAGSTAVIVSHGTAIKVGIAIALGWPSSQAMSLRGLANCAWALLDEDVESGRFRLSAYNRATPST